MNEGMGMCGTELRKLTLPSGVIFGAIIRHEEIVIPDGNSIVEDGDHLVIFVLRSAIKKLEKFLGVKLELFT